MQSHESLHSVTTATSVEQTGPAEGYLPVLTDGLRANTVLDFDLFLQQQKDHYVLYRNKNLPFTGENAERLKTSEGGCVCISARDRKKYLGYIENQLPQIITDQSVDGERKTTLLYDSAVNAVEQIFAIPPTATGLKRAIAIAENIAAHLRTDSTAFGRLVRVAPSEYRTETHSVNVCAYSLAIAQSMEGLGPEETRVLGIGALLHDIGKTKINRDIINKRGPLNTHEWEELQRHPEYGLKMLKGIEGMPPGVLPIVALHHEKINGSGYPAGLRGNEIPLAARIVCVADIFDALTSNRAYKGAVNSYEALVKISDEMQATIDNEVFVHFIKLLQF